MGNLFSSATSRHDDVCGGERWWDLKKTELSYKKLEVGKRAQRDNTHNTHRARESRPRPRRFFFFVKKIGGASRRPLVFRAEAGTRQSFSLSLVRTKERER